MCNDVCNDTRVQGWNDGHSNAVQWEPCHLIPAVKWLVLDFEVIRKWLVLDWSVILREVDVTGISILDIIHAQYL